MKFFLDANLNVALAASLRALFIGHDFTPAHDLGLQYEQDIPLFPEVARQGFDFLMTHDRNQLRNLDERHALWKSRLHWVGWKDSGQPGLLGLSLETATVTAALPHILADTPDEPTCYHLKGVAAQKEQRLKCSSIAIAAWKA
ncbi:PIN-like domain-containing protein [Streptomonospora litoralis]|uniref:VapC45 PIN like domain-containing protein n=1 Tax=Streptomonospora litoralis TaxID=2498135 RepID=A0A4P6Q2B3_9ACTN|nr:hypothetical protein [Streptomonospora litoralis]QBI54758.1 hypothetical protein EKD16_14895 [Streptomonospora litoralis]